MRFTLRDNLPFLTVTVAYRGRVLAIPEVLIDTGSGGTLFAADVVQTLGIIPEPQDRVVLIRGVGGSEVVFTRAVDYLQVGRSRWPNFEIEVGGMDYGMVVNGILGMDFLIQAGALINLRTQTLTFRL